MTEQPDTFIQKAQMVNQLLNLWLKQYPHLTEATIHELQKRLYEELPNYTPANFQRWIAGQCAQGVKEGPGDMISSLLGSVGIKSGHARFPEKVEIHAHPKDGRHAGTDYGDVWRKPAKPDH